MELEAYNWQPSIQYRILYFLKCTLAMTPYIFSARFRKLPCLQAYSRQLMVHCFAIVLYRFTLITYMPLLIMLSWMNSVVYCLLLSLRDGIWSFKWFAFTLYIHFDCLCAGMGKSQGENSKDGNQAGGKSPISSPSTKPKNSAHHSDRFVCIL